MFVYKKIIKRPAVSIVDEALISCSSLKSSIENYAISEYILEALLLKLTGFHEQKFKLIMWELASVNSSMRRQLSRKEKPFDRMGEYSDYKAKNTVYNSLVRQIKIYNGDFSQVESQKARILQSATQDIIDKFNNSILESSHTRQFSEFKSNPEAFWFKETQFLSGLHGDNHPLLQGELSKVYDKLISMRNSIAHNSRSSNPGHPSFNILSGNFADNQELSNYFSWIGVLVLVDEVVLALYNELINSAYRSPSFLELF